MSAELAFLYAVVNGIAFNRNSICNEAINNDPKNKEKYEKQANNSYYER